ncbi:MAG: calcium-binding protein, partial [Acidimicrobiales bacterium]
MADPNGVTVNLATNSATDGWGGIWGLQGTDTLSSIENIEGSTFNDTLTGDANANVIDGGVGNDTVRGGAGADSFVYSAMPASGNADFVTDFGDGADSIRLDASRLTGLTQDGPLDPSLFLSGDFTSAQNSTQRIVYNTTTGEMYYDADGLDGVAPVKIFTLQQFGSPAALNASDIVVFNAAGGGLGNVYLWSTLSDGQSIAFDPSQDQLVFDDPAISAASLTVDANTEAIPPLTIFSFGGKTVTLFTLPYALTTTNITFADGSLLIIGDNTTAVPTTPDVADGAANTIVGGSGSDLLIGLGGADSIFGGDGDDLFPMVVDEATGGTYGSDTVDGGTGSDTLVYFGPASAVNVNLGTSTGTGGDGSPGSTLTLIGIEYIVGTEFNDTLTGDANANVLDGSAGSDTIDGAAGNDTIKGGAGADTLAGGLDTDTLSYD